MTSKIVFNSTPTIKSVQEFEEFIKTKSNSNRLIIAKCYDVINLIPRNSTFWKAYQKSTSFTTFLFVQNVDFFIQKYFYEGKCAESIILEIEMYINPELLRKYLKTLLISRTKAEENIKRRHHYKNTGSSNARPELFGFEDEVIRMYSIGISMIRIAKEFNCSADHINKILKAHGKLTSLNIARVKIVTRELVSEINNNRSEYDKEEIKKKNRLTRIKNNSSYRSKEKYIKTIRERYNDPSIVNISQVRAIHEKQQKYRYYSYKLESGDTVNIQGYERYALDIVLETYNFSEISLRETFKYNHIERDPKILSRYYADIYIHSTEEIIEVKSLWTLKKYAVKNYSILLHMISHKLKFSFWVFDSKGILVCVIKTIDEFLSYVKPDFSHWMIQDFTNPERTISSGVNLK